VDRPKDWGRDLALYLGRTRCELKLRELGELAGGSITPWSAIESTASGTQLQTDVALERLVREIEHNLENRKF
jgi:hypothetical protein